MARARRLRALNKESAVGSGMIRSTLAAAKYPREFLTLPGSR
jgi:hypothetical protein